MLELSGGCKDHPRDFLHLNPSANPLWEDIMVLARGKGQSRAECTQEANIGGETPEQGVWAMVLQDRRSVSLES